MRGKANTANKSFSHDAHLVLEVIRICSLFYNAMLFVVWEEGCRE